MSTNKVILCSSDDIVDSHSWEIVKTDNDIAKITKGELSEIIDVYKDYIIKGGYPTASKTDPVWHPSGNSWSAQLQRKNYPARWITYRGNRVLIKFNKDGTGRIVFSANPSMEHLKVIPKTHEEYKKIAKEKDKKQEKRRVKESVSEAEIKEARERSKKVKEESKQVKEQYRERLAEVVGKDREQEVKEEDVKGLERDLEKKAIKKIEREEEKARREEAKKAIDEIMEIADGVGAAAKEKLTKALEDVADEVVADSILEEEGLSPEREKIKTDVKDADEKLNLLRAKLSLDEAIDIINAKEKKKEALKEIKAKYKDDVEIPQGNVEITALQGVVQVDWDKKSEDDEDKAILSALNSIEAKNRAMMNTELYKALEDREGKKTTQKEMAKGVQDTMNAVAGDYLEGRVISKEAIEFMGVQNASRLIAGAIANEGGDIDKIVKDMEDFLTDRSQEVTAEVVDTLRDKYKRVENYRQQAADDMLAVASANAYSAKQMKDIGKELGLAVGSLEASATVLDSLRDVKESRGDIVVNGGKNIARIKDNMKSFGLSEDDYFTKKNSDGSYNVTVRHESFGKMLSESTMSNKRDAMVEAIKTGEAIEGDWLVEKAGIRDWRPAGVAKTTTDWITKDAYDKLPDSKKEKFTAYKNKKGEEGYTSQFKEGTTLYGKPMGIGAMDAQQKAIKFAESQKRVVWNLGAGTGKTFSYLGTVSQLKETGKIDSFSVISPPSRLRKEFLKDAEKFFPHLKIAVLDDAKDFNKKKEMIEKAKNGEYDIILTGHDSVKSRLPDKERWALSRAMEEENYNKWKAENPDATPREKGKKRREFRSEASDKYRDYGLPNLLNEAKPSLVAVDEAHEVFKSHDQKDSLKFSAIKNLMADSEYAINGTGTTVKNSMKELGNLLHVTAPEQFPNPNKFSKKYENVNQGSTVYQSQAAEAMAREYDNVMLTEKLSLNVKNEQTQVRMDLSSKQKEQYSESERQYRLDRNSTGFGIVDTKTGNFVMQGNDLKKFDDLGFNPSADVKNMSPKEKAFLKSQGLETAWSDKENEGGYKVVKLGGANGAAQRKQSRHEKIINGGDWKDNAKAQKMSENIKANPDKKHIIFYERHASREMLQSMLKDMGVSEDAMAHIHGRVNERGRKDAVTQFQTKDGVKFMLASEAGMTGLNMQKGDVQHFLTRSSTYAKQQQAVARSVRTGREGDVQTYFYDSNTTVDDAKLDTINRKKRMSDAIKERKATIKKKLKKGLYVKILDNIGLKI